MDITVRAGRGARRALCRMWEFVAYLANRNTAASPSTPPQPADGDTFSLPIGAIAHLRLRPGTVVPGQRVHEDVTNRPLR